MHLPPAAPTPMLDDIARQPDVLAVLVARADEIAAFAAAHLTPGPGGRVHVFGSGDGWFAARAVLAGHPAALAHSGLDFLLHHAGGLTGADRALAISMSGNVDRTFEAVLRAQGAGAAVALLTNGPGGRIAATGAARLSLDMPDLAPFLCGTASYTATLAALMLAFRPGAGVGLAGVIPGLPGLIDEASSLARRIVAEIGCPPGVRWLGAGASVATADYGAAKCVELARLPSWSDDIEEFAHRQYWAMATDELVVLLPDSPEAASYADATAEALSDIATPTLALEPEGMTVPHARWRLALPGGRATATIAQAIALQPLVYHLARASGTDPDRRPHLREDAARFAVSRKLTRRSLLGTGQ